MQSSQLIPDQKTGDNTTASYDAGYEAGLNDCMATSGVSTVSVDDFPSGDEGYQAAYEAGFQDGIKSIQQVQESAQGF